MSSLLATSSLTNALLTAGALGIACAVLSVVVVLRRWAFIGEGISHAGFGGIGTGWLLSLVIPLFGNQAVVYLVAVLFCIATALAIGYISRDDLATDRVTGDAAIGIFLVTSLAWGFLALTIYLQHHPTGGAENWDAYLFGQINLVSREMMIAGLCLSAAVVLVVGMLWKEIIAYAFDPAIARVSGVRVGVIHYLLMVLLAMLIVIGMKLAGNVLVTALLVLPGATALLVSRRLPVVVGISVGVGLSGAVGGLVITSAYLKSVPSGPAMVMVMVLEFVVAYVVSRLRRG